MTKCNVLLSVLVVALIAAAAPAEPFRPQRVPSDAKWVMHIDLQAIVNSNAGQLVIEEARQRGLDEKIEAVKSLYGVNPLVDFRSITLFGTGYQPQDAVAVAQMGSNLGKLEDVVRLSKDYQLLGYRGHVIHSWIEAKGPGAGQRKYCGVWPDDMLDQTLLVIADTDKQVTTTIDLLEGRRHDLSASDSAVLAKRPATGSFLFVASDELDPSVMKDPRSAMLQAARNMTMDLGESDGNIFAHATMEAITAEKAMQIHQMMQGMMAMAQMAPPAQDGSLPPGAQLAQAVKVNRNESTVTADFQYPADQFLDLLKRIKAQEQARRAATPSSAQ